MIQILLGFGMFVGGVVYLVLQRTISLNTQNKHAAEEKQLGADAANSAAADAATQKAKEAYENALRDADPK